jgi:hypothetical protein
MARKSTGKLECGRTKRNLPSRRAGRKWITGIILAVGIAAGIGAWQWPGMLWGYKMAPSFILQSSTGRAVSLEDFRGKQEVVLIFYMGAG